MFKLGSSEDEILSSMQQSILEKDVAYSSDKFSQACYFLQNAGSLFDKAGFQAEADEVTAILLKLAGEELPSLPDFEAPEDYETCGECGFDHSYEPEESMNWHKKHQTRRCEVCNDKFISRDGSKVCELCQPADTWGDDDEHPPDSLYVKDKESESYYESAKNITISKKRAIKEVRDHKCDIREFLDEMGDKEYYDAQKVLQWLGY